MKRALPVAASVVGTRVVGRRLPDGHDIFAPGDYGRIGPGLTWHARPPEGQVGNLSNHTVTEHEDGTITVAPSILITSTRGTGEEREVWHGYLERGVWRKC